MRRGGDGIVSVESSASSGKKDLEFERAESARPKCGRSASLTRSSRSRQRRSKCWTQASGVTARGGDAGGGDAGGGGGPFCVSQSWRYLEACLDARRGAVSF